MLLLKQSSQTSSTSPAQWDSNPFAARHCRGADMAAPQLPAPSQLTQLSHHLHPCFLHLNATGLKVPGGGKRGIQPLLPAKKSFYAKLKILFHGKKELSREMQYKKPPRQPWEREVTILRAKEEPLYLLLGNSVRGAKVLIIFGYCHRLLGQRRHPPLSRFSAQDQNCVLSLSRCLGLLRLLALKSLLLWKFKAVLAVGYSKSLSQHLALSLLT